ncbi:MAG: hypothetical protein HKO08_09995 [Erythrobacter sp.]|nr:hypothetical protein [Erythrobacter sp.]
MSSPEWKLDESTQDADSYEFANVNPRLVFLLALAVGFVAVACVYFAYVSVSLAIEADMIPQPPRLQGLVD